MLQLFFLQFAAWFHLPSIKLPSLPQVFADESAQDAFEYLLVVGVVVVAIVAAAIALPIDTIKTDVSNALTGAFDAATG
jgi:hypothetical protein